MAAMTTVLKAIIKADAKSLKTELKSAEKSLEAFGKKTKETGKKLTRSVTMPIVAAGGFAIKSAADFEASMTKIESLVGLSADAVQGFTEDVKKLSGSTARAPKELADAMFFITSAGIRGAEATQTLEASAKAAAVGLGDTATIADLATSALNAYGSDVLSASDATDVMVAAVREGKLEATELAGSMGRVLPVASAMGVSFDEVGAAFAALSRTGTNANEAATQVRGILTSLLKPTKQSSEALASMGLSAEGLREQIREEGLLATLGTLKDTFNGNEAATAAVFGNVRALMGVMDMLGANSASTEAIFKSMEDTTGALDKAFAVTSETTAFKLQQAMANLKASLIAIGDVLIPIIVPIVEKLATVLKGAAEAFGKMPGPIKTLTVAFVGLAAATGPAMTLIGGSAGIIGKAIPKYAKLSTTIGEAKGKGVMGRMGSLLKVVKAHPVAFGAAAVAGVTLGVVMGRMRKNAKEARDRMNMLGKELVDAGDPTATMTSRVKELAEKLHDLNAETEEGTKEMDAFQGSTVLTSELIKRKVKTEFNELGLDMKKIAVLTKDGTDEFHKLGDETKRLVNNEEAYIRSLKNADESIRDVTTALAEQIEAKQLTTHEARQIMIAIDETADAWDDYFKILEKQAEAYLKSDEGILHVVGSLGALGDAILEQAHESGNWLEAQEEIDKALQVTDTAINGNIGGWLGYGDVVREIPIIEEEVIASEEELAAAQEALEEKLALTEERVEAVRKQFDDLVASMRHNIDEAYELDNAQFAIQEAMLGVIDSLAIYNDETLTQLERDKALVNASQAWAESLAGVGEAMAGMSIDEINAAFAEQEAWLLAIKDSIPEEEYERLSGLLQQTKTDALNLHGTDIAIKYGLDVEYTPSMLNFLNMMDTFESIEAFGASMFAGIGTGNTASNQGYGAGFTDLSDFNDFTAVAGALPFANGGIVTAPTLGLIGEAGPEAVIPLNQVGSMGGTTNVTVNVAGSVLAEGDLAETIQNQLIRIKGRNASLEFG
jgi:TP901 family phage tail tape measure protein